MLTLDQLSRRALSKQTGRNRGVNLLTLTVGIRSVVTTRERGLWESMTKRDSRQQEINLTIAGLGLQPGLKAEEEDLVCSQAWRVGR